MRGGANGTDPEDARGTFQSSAPEPRPAPVAGAEAEPEDAFARACAHFTIDWHLTRWSGQGATGLRQVLQPADLLVLGQSLPPAYKRELLREALGARAPGILICPDSLTPLSRILLVHRAHHPSEHLLQSGAELCRRFRAGLIVLTVAGTERAAHLGQLAAREALAGCGVDADFDFLVGSEVRVAVASVARWRRCQLVVMGRQGGSPWWRRLWGGATEGLVKLTGSLSFLALPEAGLPNLTSQPIGAMAASGDPFSLAGFR